MLVKLELHGITISVEEIEVERFVRLGYKRVDSQQPEQPAPNSAG